MKRSGEITSLKEVLPQILKKLGLWDTLREKQVIFNWKEIVGPDFPSQIKPLDLENQTLYLKVPSFEWKKELEYLKEELIEKINQKIGTQVVKKIKIFVYPS
jgi:predicted nucleic acid-binding Zn ribbon protein